MAARKFLKNNAGTITEEASITTSAGAADEGKIPALNASGFLDPTIIHGKASSAGAGDAAKVPLLDSSGRLDTTMMPVGVLADTASITTSEAISSGDFVNIWFSTGAKVRKADAAVAGKEAHGFVLVGVGAGAAATVYFEGTNTGVTGQTAGAVFLSAATAGLATPTAPSGSGNVVQRVGFAISPTAINFQSHAPIVLV